MSQITKNQHDVSLHQKQEIQGQFVSKKPFFFTSVLYIIASIFQLPWVYILIENFDQVKRWLTFPLIAWSMVIIYIGMLIAIPFLFIIGIKLFLLIKKASGISLNSDEIRRRKKVNLLLSVGIFFDIFFSSFLIFGTINDKSAIPFAVALFSGKILQANFEAIALYFNVRKM